MEQQQKMLTQDELYEAAQAEIAERRKALSEPPKEEPAPEPGQATPEATQEEPKQPNTPAVAEPFEGYSQLPEAVRAHYDRLRTEREQIEAEHSKLRSQYSALHGRLAPTQAQLAEAQRRLQAQQQQPAAPAPKAPAIQDWISKQPEHLQQRYKEFPEEAQIGFEIARGIVSEETARLREEMQNEIRQIKTSGELAVLAKEHPDWSQYRMVGPDGNQRPATQEGANYWNWVNAQSDEVQQAAYGNTAAEISEALTLYKWQRDNPGLQDDLQSPEFTAFVSRLPPVFAAALNSPRVSDRQYVINAFLATLDQAEPADPTKAAAIDKIAARRIEQNKPSPSIRQSATPAPAAVAGGDDAAWTQAQTFIEQQRKARQR